MPKSPSLRSHLSERNPRDSVLPLTNYLIIREDRYLGESDVDRARSSSLHHPRPIIPLTLSTHDIGASLPFDKQYGWRQSCDERCIGIVCSLQEGSHLQNSQFPLPLDPLRSVLPYPFSLNRLSRPPFIPVAPKPFCPLALK
jgi:hypothetical protein